ncbi:GNAT family N-acetyltransferase [Spirillospora sp. NPDC048911]|uniref:GNAT family N-acetyltransferase n=1 Tax=Spirillospora sp. NPDC048911 TaxID=3364527 RepID=UPI0037209214
MNTERLVLRPWPAGDITAVTRRTRCAHWADDFPAEGDGVIAGILAEHPETLGQSQIIERASGLVVGSIGLFWPPADGAVEIGYGVVPSRRGRGYAAEATRALADHALTEPDVHTVYANVELSNPPSVRVLEKAGFQLASSDGGTARYHLK